jgi:ribosomal protein L9
MKITANLSGIVLLVLFTWGIFSLGKCSLRDNLDETTIKLQNTLEEIGRDSIVIDSITHYTYTQHLAIVNNNKAINYLEGERERLKALHIKDVTAIGQLEAKIERLNIELQTPVDPVIITLPGSTDSTKYLRLPQEYKQNDEWGWATANIAYPKSTISYGIHNLPLHVVIGEQGQGLFKKSKNVVIIDTPNPFVKIEKANITLVQPKKTFLQRPLVWLGAGFVVGRLLY